MIYGSPNHERIASGIHWCVGEILRCMDPNSFSLPSNSILSTWSVEHLADDSRTRLSTAGLSVIVCGAFLRAFVPSHLRRNVVDSLRTLPCEFITIALSSSVGLVPSKEGVMKDPCEWITLGRWRNKWTTPWRKTDDSRGPRLDVQLTDYPTDRRSIWPKSHPTDTV